MVWLEGKLYTEVVWGRENNLQKEKENTNNNTQGINCCNAAKSGQSKKYDNLLKAHYGNDWDPIEELQYFKDLFRNNLDTMNGEEGNADPNNNDEEVTFW